MKIYVRHIKNFILRMFMRLYVCFHPVKKQILFSAYPGGLYADSQRAISQTMHRLFPQYQLVWILRDTKDTYHLLPSYIQVVSSKKRLNFYKALAVSFCFITNEIIPNSIYKRKRQFFIQTWHGDRGFKKIIYESNVPTPGTYDNIFTDLCVAGSDAGTEMYHNAFRYSGEILQIGMPRNDQLVTKNFDIATIKQKLGLNKNSKILLYAPTFRDHLPHKQTASVDLQRTLQLLQKQTPDTPWYCLIRAHTSSRGIEFPGDNTHFINVSDYPDMADLLCITDILLTDYSSCAGDFILLKKPVILTIFDQQTYIRQCREFKCPPEETGFLTIHTQQELELLLEKLDDTLIQDSYQKVMKYYGITETGKSSEEICKRIHQFYQKNFLNS